MASQYRNLSVQYSIPQIINSNEYESRKKNPDRNYYSNYYSKRGAAATGYQSSKR